MPAVRLPRRAGRVSHLDAYVVGVVLAAATVMIATLARADRDSLLGRDAGAVLVFGVLLVVGEARPLKWLRLNDGGELTASWSFALAILLLDAPAGSLALVALASAVADLLHRKPPMRVAFNAAQITLSLAVAVMIMSASGQLDTLASGEPLGLPWFAAAFCAAAALFTVNATLILVALALHEGTSVNTMMRRGMLLNLATDGALVALAPIFVVVAMRSLLLLPLIVAMAGFVHRSTRAALDSEHQANHDELTTLLNRRAFLARITDELSGRSADRPCALVLIDLDDFKQTNDQLGHAVGDAVLREVGVRLGGRQRQGEIAARLGGDEFALLLTQASSSENVRARVEQLLASLTKPLDSLGFPIAIGASVGVAMWPHDGSGSDDLMQAADLAMYVAKRDGNSVRLCQDNAASNDVGRVTLLADLQHALARDELTVWYQPQLDLSSGRVTGVEALIRWHHPRLGLIPPDQFMPLAEHTDLMGAITEFVVGRAVRDLAEWLPLHPTLRVAVNVSAQNLHDLEFPKLVARSLASRSLPVGSVEIEITENALLAHPDRAKAVLETLSRAGVRLIIDDFGTGFSSLANLRQLPVEAIKIDRSFVRDMVTDPDDHAVVRSVVDLARSLGLRTVAEGVESTACLEVLRGMGCSFAQGYLIARPMPAEQVPEWLASVGDRLASRLARGESAIDPDVEELVAGVVGAR